MTVLKSLLEQPVSRQLRPGWIDVILPRLGVYSRFGIVLAAICSWGIDLSGGICLLRCARWHLQR